MPDSWRVEVEAASRTIERLGRQLRIYREAMETVANSATSMRPVAEKALAASRKIDLEKPDA